MLPVRTKVRYGGEIINRVSLRDPEKRSNLRVKYTRTDLAKPEKIEPEENGKIWTVTKEQLLNDFLLFTILILGMQVKNFHRKWAQFMLQRKKCLVMAPRDHGKTWVLSIAYIIWRIVKNPNIRILLVANSAGKASEILGAIQSHLESNETLIGMFGKFKGRPWLQQAFTVCQRTAIGLPQPTVTAIGVYGSLVSGHYDLVVCEDLVDFENSRTKVQRDKLWQWFWTVVFPCIETSEDDPTKDGELQLRGTRYHADDMYGRMIGEVEQFKPGALHDDYIRDQAILPGVGHKSLWPERKSYDRLIQIKKDVGSIIFALQYQNDASLTVGRIFGPSYFLKVYTKLPDPEDIIVLGGFDLAVSQSEESDYFAEADIAIHRKTKDIYLLDIWRQRLTAPKQFDAIKNSYGKWRWHKCGVENVAYQEALVQWLKQNTNVPVKSIPRSKDKVTRAYKIQPHFENGKFFMPADRRFADFIDEMCLFPDTEHDDQFDALETAIDMGLGRYAAEFKYFFI